MASPKVQQADPTGGRSELIAVLGDVKARVQDKLGIVDFPMPQFILIGKQSVGKSRLCEALAGETFNFISGTLGSRRPTVLEFRNVASATVSRWSVRGRDPPHQWSELPTEQVMEMVGKAHEELGEDVTDVPIYVRLESANSVDMSIVDLPGFRDFAADARKQALSDKIDKLVFKFMEDSRNVMLCCEQCGDAANMSTLGKCKEIDPKLERTILIRGKLDKYYNDLVSSNINDWVMGHNDIPKECVRFALTLPNWPDGQSCPVPFAQMRADKSQDDIKTLTNKGLKEKLVKTIGFNNFQKYMEDEIERRFSAAVAPVLTTLRDMEQATSKKVEGLTESIEGTDPTRILGTTRDCGISFATALTHVMEGVLRLKTGRITLQQELEMFHEDHKRMGDKLGQNAMKNMIPSDDMSSLEDYVAYLRDDLKVGAFDVEINGGAQYRRLMSEVETFLRFSTIGNELKKKDVVQARGVSMTSLTWRDVIVKILSVEAHQPLQLRVLYVGARLKWFFERQKDAVIEFMDGLEGTPAADMFSPLYPKHVKLIQHNEMIKKMVFETYDNACQRQLDMFIELFDNVLVSTFSNPWVFLKGATPQTDETDENGELKEACLPSFDDTKKRIPKEITDRNQIEKSIQAMIQAIPNEPEAIDQAVDKVQELVLRSYAFIRSQICDQVELFAESFFKLPMLRRLEEDMSLIELSEADKEQYGARRTMLEAEAKKQKEYATEIDECIKRLNDFKIKTDAKRAR